MAVKQVIGRVMANPFIEDGTVLLSKVSVKDDLKADVLKAVNLIGGFESIIEEGDKVLVKPNYNSADPPPASTDPEFLKNVIELLFQHGASEVVVGESSMQTTSTRKTMQKTGTLEAIKGTGAEAVFFDEGKWIKVDVNGEYLKSVSLAEKALQMDKLVYCCCMKTHFRADFSLSLKLAFGFTKGSERMGFHARHLKEKLVDLNLAVYPNLTLMDGRKCFIKGGPFSGEVREPNVMMAAGDRVAMDVESIKIMGNYEGAKLKEDPWSYTQIRRAKELELGVQNEKEYKVIRG